MPKILNLYLTIYAFSHYDTSMKLPIKSCVLIIILAVIVSGCFLFPTDPQQPEFEPTAEWVNSTGSYVPLIMDVFANGNILCVSYTSIGINDMAVVDFFTPQGVLLNRWLTGERGYHDYYNVGKPVKAIVNNSTGFWSIVYDFEVSSFSYATSVAGYITNPYRKYNTSNGEPDFNNSPNALQPSIVRAENIGNSSTWMVGAFTDSFKPFNGGIGRTENTCTTFGKADCFVVRYDFSSVPVHHQWGGAENDVAYGVLGDNDGNATIFLRAGSDFGITSATQSLVRMKTGYNVVKLDTNGLMLSTYTVPLQAQGEISHVELATAGGDAMFILAKDEKRGEYFLVKASPAGIAWTRYFGQQVSTKRPLVFRQFGIEQIPYMGLTSDSKGNAYITGNYYHAVDFGGRVLDSEGLPEMFVASYSGTNALRGVVSASKGSSTGYTLRLSPDEQSLYVTGWGEGEVLGVKIPSSPLTFLVKLKLTK